ncbi:MAG TPA: acyltransferase family protein [Propionicimonas sp.]|nr:acyltransferase family protein [Propionicimonas sp.]
MVEASDSGSRFRPDIQGLRAVAVSAVVLYHAGLPLLPGGYVGVDVFFVISGFLITSHLLSGLARHGRVSFAEFYARRARRILPASFVVLILSTIAAVVWFPPVLMSQVWRGAVATALYVPNVLFAVQGTDYLADTAPSLFQHYWSLGVEEQFYLIWPALLALGWKAFGSKTVLKVVLALLVAASFGLGVWLTFVSQPWAFFSLPTRAWELGLGAAIAFQLQQRSRLIPAKAAPIVGWLGILAIVAASILLSSNTLFPGYWAALPTLGTAAVIAAGATASRWGPTSVLSTPPMQFLGLISYSLYLVHWPALVVPQAAVGFGNPLPLRSTLSIAVLCVPAAWLLYRFVENPMRSTPFLAKARPRRSLWGALVGSLVSISLASAAFAGSSATQLSSTTSVAATAISESPVGTAFVPTNLTPSLREAADDLPALYADGCHRSAPSTDSRGCLYGSPTAPQIVLFGDSHAAQWFPALHRYAQQHGLAIMAYTKSSCPSVWVDSVNDGVIYQQCLTWRAAVIKRIAAKPPRLVVLSNYSRELVDGNPATRDARWQQGLIDTIDQLGAPAAVILDTPEFAETPADCLSSHLDDTASCDAPRDRALNPGIQHAEVTAASRTGTPVLDPTIYLCNAMTCPAIQGNTLVYRDKHHLTATFSSLLGPTLGAHLEPYLGRRPK